MLGNTFTRSVNAFRHMLMRPHHATRWMGNRMNGKTPIEQGLPWFSYTAIDFLESWLKPGMSVFEWGGGGSTVFFASRGCKVTTVESHEGWAGKVREKLLSIGKEVSDRVEIRAIPAETKDPAQVKAYVEAFATGGPWDLVIIDGLEESYISRMDCVRFVAAHLDKLTKGACVALDDSWRPTYDETPKIFAALKPQLNWGLGPSRMGVTRTDFYWNNR